MTGWVRLGGLGVVATLCPVGGLTVDAHVEALGVALSERLEICREDLPGGAGATEPDAAPRTAPRPAVDARAGSPPTRPTHPGPHRPEPPEPHPGPPAAPPAPAAHPAPPERPAPPRVRELLVPVRLESRARPARPAPAPPPRPSFGAPGYRAAEAAERVGGRSMVTTTMVVTTPAVLAAALLRPRSRSAASGARSRPNPPSGGPS